MRPAGSPSRYWPEAPLPLKSFSTVRFFVVFRRLRRVHEPVQDDVDGSELRLEGVPARPSIDVEPPLEVTTTVDPSKERVVVSVNGPVDVYSASILRAAVITLMPLEGWKTLIIDLTFTSFLDSAGMGVLVGALKRLRAHDRELVLVCPHRRMLKLFEITGLEKVFVIVDDPAVLD
jgi:anti-sigma B factor antagonist